MSIEKYWAPTSVDEALDALAGGEVTVLAGGTDLMPQSNAGRVAFARGLLNIRRIAAIRGISEEAGVLRIGAATTIAELGRDERVRERMSVLGEACEHFASEQVRNAGTVGGNVCNASPAGDLLPPLLVLGAEVELASKRDGVRRVPMSEFFTGPGRTVRRPDELVTAIRVPMPAPGFVSRFYKSGTRVGMDISAVSIAIGGVLRDGRLGGVRVAYGAVAPIPLLAARTAAALEGAPLDAALAERAAALARDEVQPIDDVRASAWYRRELVHNVTSRMLRDVARA